MKTIVIVGAGPAGSSAAFFLGKAGVPHILLDKAKFPRSKTCGDGLAPRACLMLERMRPDFVKNLTKNEAVRSVWGGRLISPSGYRAELFLKKPATGVVPNALSIPRREFDFLLTEQLDPKFTDFRQGIEIRRIEREGTGFQLFLNENGQETSLRADILIGCDGDRSIVKKTFAPARLDPDHYVAGIRTYFRGVQGLHEHHFFEFFFLKELLPGYLWIFPLPDGSCNVGLGMLTADVSRTRANLREILQHTLAENPLLKTRFATAEQIGKIEGWGLPLGSKIGRLSGDGFLLTGDAASLIDPLTGEGVGNALYSGWLAAEAAANAVAEGRSDAQFFRKKYDRRVFKTIRPELRFSQFWSWMFQYPRLTDHIFRKIGSDAVVQNFINTLYDSAAFRRVQFNPFFYLRFLFSLIF